MDVSVAAHLLKKAGFQPIDTEHIPEGTSHDIFSFITEAGDSLVARFEKDSHRGADGVRRDFHYNGRITLEREAYLCDLVRTKGGLPAPGIKGTYDLEGKKFLIAQRMEGQQWDTFIRERNYSLRAFTDSLEYLAQDLAAAQKVTFPSYGNVMPGGIEPNSIYSFSQRLEQMMQLKIDREENKGALTPLQLGEVRHALERELKEIEHIYSPGSEAPVLILADLHPTNFLVDKSGKPSGYVDLEFCQAGHPVLELYMLDFQFFNYFDRKTWELSRNAFLSTFREAGGHYDPQDDPLTVHAQKVLGIGRFLTCVTGYHGVKDGLRDMWSEQCKELLFQTLHIGDIDYVAFGDIFRKKTKQPLAPNLP